MTTNPPSELQRAMTRVFWLVVTGVIAFFVAPEIAVDAARSSIWATTPSALRVLSVIIVGQVLFVWLATALLCGLLMEQQPWYRNLYLVVLLVLCFLLVPAVD